MTPIRDASLLYQIQRLTLDMETRARREFLAAIQDIKDRAILREIRDALSRNDVEAAIRAIGIENAAFRAFQAALVEAYTAAALLQTQSVVWRGPPPPSAFIAPDGPPLSRVTVRFDLDNPTARQWLSDLSSTRITNIVRQQIDTIRQAIEAGYSQGRGPNDIARDIIGRVGPNGRRVGGLLGLSDPQAQWVQNMRQYLETDPARALRMSLRDRGFDRVIRRAIREERRLSAAQINRMVSAYERRLLLRRGQDIARTETSQAVSAARFEAMRQGLQKAGLPESAVVKKWFHAGPALNNGERVDHMMLNRTEVRGLNTPFLPSGVPMMHPHDPNAPAEQVINCRCGWTISVDYAALAR